jgi:hypothetical protein
MTVLTNFVIQRTNTDRANVVARKHQGPRRMNLANHRKNFSSVRRGAGGHPR